MLKCFEWSLIRNDLDFVIMLLFLVPDLESSASLEDFIRVFLLISWLRVIVNSCLGD